MKKLHSNTDKIASAYLGKKTNGSEFYNPKLLIAVPRFENRQHYGINNDNLPFMGIDIWHAYEFSVMTESGLPITRLLKIKYNCNNDYIIESKSLKLYLNSFNMSKFGKTINDALNICRQKIENDLSEKLRTPVQTHFLDSGTPREEIFTNFHNLMDYVDKKNLTIENFKETPELLNVEQTNHIKEYYLQFDSLRSNCRVTHQPDFGDVFIFYKSSKHIQEDSLLKYLCSFRSEYHFHEECCEMIYKRLCDKLDKDDELFVCALYTRRGGIDICPARWSKNCIIEDVFKLTDVTKFARRGIKQ